MTTPPPCLRPARPTGGGETDLDKLIASMKPSLAEDKFVFCTLDLDKADHRKLWTDVLPPARLEANSPVSAEMHEAEGPTLVLAKAFADRHGFEYEYVAARITLQVHSALEAVGLTAAFSGALGDNEISCNVVAGYFHDHLYVNWERREAAVAALEKLSRDAQGE